MHLRYTIFFCIAIFLHLLAITFFSLPAPASAPSAILLNVEYKEGSTVAKETKMLRNAPSSSEAATNSHEPSQSQSQNRGQKTEDFVFGGALGITAKYPRLSRLLKEEGRVLFLVTKNASGKIDTLKILASSGFSRLDDAALSALQDAHSKSALEEALKNRERLEIAFVFRLTTESQK